MNFKIAIGLMIAMVMMGGISSMSVPAVINTGHGKSHDSCIYVYIEGLHLIVKIILKILGALRNAKKKRKTDV